MVAGAAMPMQRGRGVKDAGVDAARVEAGPDAPARAPAEFRRRPDGGIDTEHYAARARRLRRAGLRGHIAWLLAALR
jgi:hypothetical protein